MKTRVLVCGSRNLNISPDIVDECITDILEEYENSDIEFVSGGAKGGDALGEDYAHANNYPVTIFKPDWSSYGKAAGPMRNTQMVNYIDECDNPVVIAFWDGVSKGTRNTIKTAQKLEIPVHIVRCNNAKHIIEGGIQLDSDNILYDWDEDEPEDILPLEGNEVGQRRRNGHTFYYAFRANKSHPDWKRFLPIFKHSQVTPDLERLIDITCRRLIIKYNMFDCILYPESTSILNELMIKSFRKIDTYMPAYAIKKLPPTKVEVNWDKFNKEYTGNKEVAAKRLKAMIERIHKSNRFSMQHQVHGPYRKFITGFLDIEDLDAALDDILMSQTILVLDDVYTTGSTLLEIINMLKSIGYEGDIVTYSLIDNK